MQKEINKIIEEIKTKIELGYPNFDITQLEKAIKFSKKAHASEIRLSGEEFFVHPVRVAHIVVFEMNLDPISTMVAFLHKSVENIENISIKDIEDEFGEEVAKIVDGITNISKTKYKSKNESHAASFRKMIQISTLKDIRVILVKLADRLHNMRTLKFVDRKKQIQTSKETRDLYAPIAHRLGLYNIKSELEDLSFKYLNRDKYDKVAKLLDEKKTERETFIKKTIDDLKKLLISVNLSGEVSGRAKHIFSIYEKMEKSKKEFNQLYDLTAFRIILNKKEDCYHVLGEIHSKYKAISGRFKDYISLPKSNGYQSLHTAVFINGKMIEIQIRTQEMHAIAENGVAAHWAYKGKGAPATNKVQKEQNEINFLKKIVKYWLEEDESEESLDHLSEDLKAKEIYVFTPSGDIIILSEGATLLDFAYSIHTELGNECTGGMVDGKIAPLKQKLKSGQIVSVNRSSSQKPKIEWLEFVTTSRARSKISYLVNKEERDQAKEIGKALLEKELAKININLNKREDELDARVRESKFSNIHNIYIALGYRKISLEDALKKILPPDHQKLLEQKEQEEKNKFATLLKKFKKSASKSKSGVIIDGLDEILIKFAKCCNPIPNENIVGYISMGQGVTVHKTTCKNILSLDKDRMLEASWAGSKATRPVITQIRTLNKVGILSEITKVLSKMSINIETLATNKDDENSIIEMTMTLSISDVDVLKKIKQKLNNINGVVLVNFRRTI